MKSNRSIPNGKNEETFVYCGVYHVNHDQRVNNKKISHSSFVPLSQFLSAV